MKRLTKRNIAKKIASKRKTRKYYGGNPNDYLLEENLSEKQQRRNLFRRTLSNYVIQISKKNNIKQGIKNLKKLFENNQEINSLIPISESGRPVDKQTYSLAKKPIPIYDFVSPIILILDNLSDVLPIEDIISILNVYFINGGDFNKLSIRKKLTPFENEINKRRIENVKMLLDQRNAFHIIEDGLQEETKTKLAELIPNEQKIVS